MKALLFILTFLPIFGFSQNQELTKYDALLSGIETIEELRILKPFVSVTSFRYIPTVFPLKDNSKFRITSLFGARNHPIEKKVKFHRGIDIAAEIGTLVIATADGVVESISFSDTGHGRSIKIKHMFGYQTLYSHLAIILIEKGKKVKKGDVIGMVGSTGKSTGNHLHYEIIKNNKSVNPSDYIILAPKS